MTKKADEPEAEATGTDIMMIVEHNPALVLLQPESAELLFDHIQKEVEAFEPDMTTTKGRDACRALAAKVTKTKTTVDKSRLALTEEARAKIKIINEAGSTIKERLEALHDRARAPLTAWEVAEDTRQAECKAALERFRQAAIVPLDATADGLRARINEVAAVSMDENLWQSMLDLADKARSTALEALKSALGIVEQKERDAAELVRLREEAAAREAQVEQERLAREEQQRAEQEAREAEESERRAMAEANARAEQEEADREAEQARREQEAADAAERTRIASEQAAAAAAERAREEEAARARDEAAATQRAHEAELQAERERAAAAEEREANRLAAEAAAAAERAKLEANQARRTAAKREAKEALMTTGMSEDHAQKAVLLIIAQEVPRVFLDFAAEPKVQPEPKEKLL